MHANAQDPSSTVALEISGIEVQIHAPLGAMDNEEFRSMTEMELEEFLKNRELFLKFITKWSTKPNSHPLFPWLFGMAKVTSEGSRQLYTKVTGWLTPNGKNGLELENDNFQPEEKTGNYGSIRSHGASQFAEFLTAIDSQLWQEPELLYRGIHGHTFQIAFTGGISNSMKIDPRESEKETDKINANSTGFYFLLGLRVDIYRDPISGRLNGRIYFDFNRLGKGYFLDSGISLRAYRTIFDPEQVGNIHKGIEYSPSGPFIVRKGKGYLNVGAVFPVSSLVVLGIVVQANSPELGTAIIVTGTLVSSANYIQSEFTGINVAGLLKDGAQEGWKNFMGKARGMAVHKFGLSPISKCRGYLQKLLL